MDYWLRLNHPIGCVTANDQEQVSLRCIRYPIQNKVSTENADLFKENRQHMFYSQRDLREYFGESEKIKSYLTCKCETCQKTRNTIKGLPTHQEHLRENLPNCDGPLVLALLVILRRIHFIYKLPLSSFQRLDELYKSLGKVEWVEEYFPDEQHRNPFIEAFEEVIGMLQPARFIFDSGRFETFPKNTRFPFQNVSTIREAREGVGSIERFEILDEYQDSSIENVIDRHPGSVDVIGSHRKFFFAKKSIPLPPKIDALANEIEILQNVSKFKSDNLIDLLACYEWQNEIHLVFPYINGTLHDILHGQRPSTPLKVSDRNPLPNNWLWKEMVGLSQALESIHTQIWIPMAEKATRANVAHCDLKPNNILVDNVLVGKEKLKITDFGHCFISFASDDGNSGPMTTHGHPRYAPPETSTSTDEWEGDHSHDIGVLNYDVWSLACIMVEVLVYVFDIKEPQQDKTPIAQFHEAIRSSPLNECFYDDTRSVKRCVNETLTKIGNLVLFDEAHQNYKASVITLLRDMFNRNPRRRLSSSQVAERLQSIRADFDKTYNCDERAILVNSYNPKEDSFDERDEIAWKFEIDSAIGFVAMDDIKIRAISRRKKPEPGESTPCRIRIFENRSEPRLLLIAYAQQNTNEVKIIRITPPDWCFQPIYLYKEGSRDCVVFRAECFENGHESMYTTYVFTFKHLADIYSFQGAILKKEIMHTAEFSRLMKASMSFTRRHGKAEIPVKNASVQFWAERPVIYLHSSTVSDFEQPQKPRLKIDTMAIFAKEELIEVPLGDHRKKFSKLGPPPRIQATVNEKNEHRHFFSHWYPVINPLFDSNGVFATTPSIQPGKSTVYYRYREKSFNWNKDKRGCLKMTYMQIETNDDRQLMHAVAEEWKPGSGGEIFDPKTGTLILHRP